MAACQINQAEEEKEKEGVSFLPLRGIRVVGHYTTVGRKEKEKEI